MLCSFLVNFPTKLIFGSGKVEALPDETAALGNKVFLVMDPWFRDTSIGNGIINNLQSRGLEVTQFYDIVPNPLNTDIDRAISIIRQNDCDVVVAVGGGSAIDTAKTAALVAVHGGECWDYTERLNADVKRPASKGLGVIAVPTTAGTGAEATMYAIINNPVFCAKCAVVNPSIFPEVSIIDPQLMVSKPKQLTVLTGIDAFAHAFESYINIKANPWSEMIALEAMKLFSENIRQCFNNGTNLEARSNMAWASTLAGIAISHAGTTVPHALGQVLGGLTDAPHGGSIAACINQVIEWTLPESEGKLADVAQILDASVAHMSVREKAVRLPGIIAQLFKDLDCTVNFSSYSLKQTQIIEFAGLVWENYQIDLGGHPKKVTLEDIVQLVNNCI